MFDEDEFDIEHVIQEVNRILEEIKDKKPLYTLISIDEILQEEPLFLKPASKKLADYIDDKIFEKAKNSYREVQCTCGAEKCGSNLHSDWCDKHD